jgi:hypothetical protein
VLGRQELEKLRLRKQALLLESDLNRLVLQAETRSLGSATSWVSEATRASRGVAPLLLALAPLASFLLAREPRRSDSWFSRVARAAKMIVPLYQLWKSFSAARKEAEPAEPAG